MLTLSLKTPLPRVLGDKTAKVMAKQLGLETVADLLLHFPRRYAKRGELTPLARLPIGEAITVNGMVRSVRERPLRGRKGSLLEVLIGDEVGSLTLTFFNQSWRKNELRIGATGLFSGKVTQFQNTFQLSHPDYELFSEEVDADSASAWAELPIPIYPASAGMPSWKIAKAVQVALEQLSDIDELVPAEVLVSGGYLPLRDAIRSVHVPEVDSAWQSARDSLRFHEALLLQLKLAVRRRELQAVPAVARSSGQLLFEFDKRLPFDLTQGQFEVGEQIAIDMASGQPMQRLLQGEVGSGKTVVAARAIAIAAESGGQSAFLAPTEVLAQQHYLSLRETFGEQLTKRLGLCLLTGKTPTAERKRVLLDLAAGKSLLVVGTHAILSEQVSFLDLALIIVDEQHKFGVRQRSALSAKAELEPHLLLMTATPIPRSVAVTIFGELQVSELRQLPAGRQKITTHLVGLDNPGLVVRIWQRAAEEIAQGRQVFVVCPKIRGTEGEVESDLEAKGVDIQDDETDTTDTLEPEGQPATPEAAAENIVESLRLNPALVGVEIGLLHGQLALEQKQQAMTAFMANEIQLLVATTVIEVGVNVPNASMMVILNAESFGMAQLHQLRGRVGRGEHGGLCVLVSNAQPDSLAHERLTAIVLSTDGFELSERDLEIRGEGDVLGDAQSGRRSSLRILRVVQDADLIQDCRGLADQILSDGLTPELSQALQEISQAEAISRS